MQSPIFVDRESIFFHLAKSGLRQTWPSQVPAYLSSRELWEDYDICLFDENLKWCVDIAHNGAVIVVSFRGK